MLPWLEKVAFSVAGSLEDQAKQKEAERLAREAANSGLAQERTNLYADSASQYGYPTRGIEAASKRKAVANKLKDDDQENWIAGLIPSLFK